jgi:hypothetical protein
VHQDQTKRRRVGARRRWRGGPQGRCSRSGSSLKPSQPRMRGLVSQPSPHAILRPPSKPGDPAHAPPAPPAPPPQPPPLADDCTQRLQSLLATDLTADGPYTAMNTNVMAGDGTDLPAVLRLRPALPGGTDLTPPGQPATLHREGAGLAPPTAQGGWTLAWETDADEAAQGMEDQRQAAAAAVEGATCTEGRRDGGDRGHARADAAFRAAGDGGLPRRRGYGAGAGNLSYAYVINGMPVTANYQISRAPGLTLPAAARTSDRATGPFAATHSHLYPRSPRERPGRRSGMGPWR